MDTKRKNTWKTIWGWALKTLIAFVLDVTVIQIGNLQGHCTSFNVPCWAITTIVIVFLLLSLLFLVQLFWICITKATKKIVNWQKKPRIKLWFELPNENDLRLYIYNPKRAKETRVECSWIKATNLRGESYTNEHRQELKLLNHLYDGTSNFILIDTLLHDDKREIKLGILHDDKVAIYFGNALLNGFPDETFKYTISCTGEYIKNRFHLPDKSVWLTIKNGVLISIKDEL
ncbi:MAG: hypothetical protein ABSA01_06435 [Anaerolineales bacterium]